MRKARTTEGEKPVLISLFAGAGGLDIGLEEAGFQTIVANELEPHACETLRANKLRLELSAEQFELWFAEQIRQKCYKDLSPEQIERSRKRLLPPAIHPPYLKDAVILEGDIKSFPSAEFLRIAGRKRGQIDLVAGGSLPSTRLNNTASGF